MIGLGLGKITGTEEPNRNRTEIPETQTNTEGLSDWHKCNRLSVGHFFLFCFCFFVYNLVFDILCVHTI